MTAFLLVVVLVAVYTFTQTPIYQASVQIEIDYESPKVVPFKEVTDSKSGGYDPQEYYQTQYKILQSRSLARRTLDSANLWKHPLLVRAGWLRRARRSRLPVGRGFPGRASRRQPCQRRCRARWCPTIPASPSR